MSSLSGQKLPRRISGLDKLAYNLWWSWHAEARDLFKVLDRPLWKATGHNPVKLLQQIAPYRLTVAAEDPGFLQEYDSVMSDFEATMSEVGTWCSTQHPGLRQHTIAYFSMEFAVHNSLPLYAGGLGVLAGDYCKEASDLGLPMVGVGFMYPQGYFHQRISEDGWQEETYTQLDFSEAPIAPVLDGQKQPLRVRVELESRSTSIAVWQVNVGQVKLYLLDTDLEENCPGDRQLSARLYGGNAETRLQQEIVLGIGGVRILRAIGVDASIWHANEGHAAFMMLERCREWMEKGLSFAEALNEVRAGTVFTTHTPVAAGNDVFPHGLIERYFRDYWGRLGLDRDAFLKLGTSDTESTSFSMTVLGLRMAHHCNGVSRLHGAMCRRMWHCLWPDVGEEDVPIGSVTNGVHVPTWIAPQMARLYEEYLGADWLARHDEPALWDRVADIPDEEMWVARRWLKSKLINCVQERARRRWSEDHGSPAQVLAMGALLDPEALTIGFSRRFTHYKRAALILRDADRLKRLLYGELRPIQIVFAGKAHPHDEPGKLLIQQVHSIARSPEFGGRIAFVEDYDMHTARYLVHGVDVWLNTPQQLQEASGTSGMKAALNGVPHLSVLDGWWYEAYDGANGWAIGRDVDSCDATDADEADADELYQLLENRVVPLYYDRDLNGIPRGWIRVVKQAIRTGGHCFSARRMAKEYTEQMYLPAARTSVGAEECASPHEQVADEDYLSERVLKTPAPSPASSS
ncbi:MAG: alpha-glucan family phosphorylase [Chloroflexota bacterium]|nr:alpha-glucan family phosphorylase [Chloroflexota bacterium]